MKGVGYDEGERSVCVVGGSAGLVSRRLVNILYRKFRLNFISMSSKARRRVKQSLEA